MGQAEPFLINLNPELQIENNANSMVKGEECEIIDGIKIMREELLKFSVNCWPGKIVFHTVSKC